MYFSLILADFYLCLFGVQELEHCIQFATTLIWKSNLWLGEGWARKEREMSRPNR